MQIVAVNWTDLILWLAIVALLVLASALSMMALYGWALRRLDAHVTRLAAGGACKTSFILLLPGIRGLAESLNTLSARASSRDQAALHQGYEMGTVLSSMVEGVIVVDMDRQIISVNAAAGKLLRIDPDTASRKAVEEVAPHAGFQRLIRTALETDEAVQDDLVLNGTANTGSTERYLQVQSAPLRNATGQRIGGVVVLHDVSELRRLEGVRRDFVANVSHEIKTPVTTIKGCAETLLEIPDHSREDLDRFLKIIARQADRLHAIVTDLLTLSRVEQNFDDRRMELEFGRVAEIIKVATESCQFRADDRDIRIESFCDPELTAPLNAPLLEQAVINLVDNAIKYSPPGSTVRVEGNVVDDEVVISIHDQGAGIEPEHLLRVFERFYRTDKARSRELGGTGLGLAIVKHVAQIHGGHADVDSTVGEGSTFRIHLPRQSVTERTNPQATPEVG